MASCDLGGYLTDSRTNEMMITIILILHLDICLSVTMVLGATKVSRFKRAAGQSKSSLTCGGLKPRTQALLGEGKESLGTTACACVNPTNKTW